MIKEEKRKFIRLKKKLPVRYQIRGDCRFSYLESDDISIEGMGFTQDGFLTPNTLLMLEIKILKRILNPIGEVVWVNHIPHTDRYRVGIRFLEINSDDKKFLEDYLDTFQEII